MAQRTLNPSLARNRPPEPGGVPRGIPPASIQPSVPGQFGAEQGQWVRLPGNNFAPAGAVNVDAAGDAVIAPGASAVLVTINVPDQFRLRINGIGFHAGDPTALRFLSWQIQENGVQIPGYTNQIAAVGSFRQLSVENIVRGYSASIQLVAIISSAAVISYTYVARIQGWFYSDKEGSS